MTTVRAVLALGGNLGDRKQIIKSAIRALKNTEGIEVVAKSPLVESHALTEAGVDESRPNYLNGVVEIETTLKPGDLLDRVLPGHDVVVNFAAETHVDRSIHGPQDFVVTNVVGTQTLLDACLRHGIPRTVHIGTDEVYGSIDEGSFTETDLLAPGVTSLDNMQALRRAGEGLEEEAPDTVRFTRAIKEVVAYEERLGVIEALWSVVLADGVREAEEDALMRLASNLLGVNDRDSAMARQRVERA